MCRIPNLLGVGLLLLSVFSCRASFQNIQKQNLQATGEGRPAADNDIKPLPKLENRRELDIDQSRTLGCSGSMIMRELGQDKNLDGVLQPTEVVEVLSDCQSRPGADQPIVIDEDFGNSGDTREGNGSNIGADEDLGTRGEAPCSEPNQLWRDGRCIPIPIQSTPTQNTPIQSGD